jgi:nucleotide-binding universal stress UspA family protein
MNYYNLHTLLAATDLSVSSHSVALRAAMMAQRIGAKLELIHVLDKKELNELQRLLGKNGKTVKEHVRSQTRELLLQLANEVGEPLGENASCHLAEGDVIGAITAQADTLNADLLIVGAQASGFIQQRLLGTTAERLLRMTQCSVLSVKQSPHMAYQSVLVPIDFSPWSLDAIHLAQVIAPQAELTLLHAYQIPFENQMRKAGEKEDAIQHYQDKIFREADARLHQTAIDAGISTTNWQPKVKYGDAVQQILEREKEQRADLVVIGKRGHGIVEEFLLGSNTRKILTHSQCDVLIANR